MREREVILAENQALRRILKSAAHALRSYEFGNGSPDLARTIAAEAELALAMADQREAVVATEVSEGRS
ncbi:hypothetical protein ACLNGM_09890 [Aureimonas phyllosphaerae]|uniref:hypothetical protein n=1 Tax=Aureimonas phyllosphaerae TaxID=1166078 RepID=UPI003A5BD3EF